MKTHENNVPLTRLYGSSCELLTKTNFFFFSCECSMSLCCINQFAAQNWCGCLIRRRLGRSVFVGEWATVRNSQMAPRSLPRAVRRDLPRKVRTYCIASQFTHICPFELWQSLVMGIFSSLYILYTCICWDVILLKTWNGWFHLWNHDHLYSTCLRYCSELQQFTTCSCRASTGHQFLYIVRINKRPCNWLEGC
jgi:hypothetical protein